MSEQDDVKRIGAMPAFPFPISAWNKPNAGMTIRQYTAVAAMAAIVHEGDVGEVFAAKRAAEYADALLAELAK